MVLVLNGIPHVILETNKQLMDYFNGYSDTCSLTVPAGNIQDAVLKAKGLFAKYYTNNSWTTHTRLPIPFS
jgi:hypothetical protein